MFFEVILIMRSPVRLKTPDDVFKNEHDDKSNFMNQYYIYNMFTRHGTLDDVFISFWSMSAFSEHSSIGKFRKSRTNCLFRELSKKNIAEQTSLISKSILQTKIVHEIGNFATVP